MRVVTQMGIAYRVSDKNYKRLLEHIKATGWADIEKFGTRLGQIVNVTDMDAREAAYQLEQLEQRENRK